LSRFYGGTPTHWLEEAPQVVFRTALTNMTKLEAEESLLTANRTAVGTGSLESKDARRVADEWTRAANGGRKPLITKATPGMLAEMGIGVHGVITR